MMEARNTIGRAMAQEFGADPDSPIGGTFASLVDLDTEEKKVKFAQIDPFFAQVFLDYWRHQKDDMTQAHETLKQEATGQIVRVIESKITRILDAFGGNEPDPELHKLLLNRDYCDRVFSAACGLQEFLV